MTTYEILYAPEAREDIRAIYTYIAFDLQMPDTAKRQVDRIREEICELDIFPERYEQIDWEPWRSMDMRRLPVDRFVVFYCIREQIVEIVRIFYGGRDIEALIKE